MRVRYGINIVLLLLVTVVVLATATSSATAMPGQSGAVAVNGPDAVGALFTLNSNGTLGDHFCTGSVVHSRTGNVVLTAAHCVSGQTPGSFAFVPGYQNGSAPHGIWIVDKVFVDHTWSNSSDPDHDFAFLVVSKHGSQSSLEKLTGSERLGVGSSAGKLATVVGYPTGTEAPIACASALVELSSTQLQFVCGGYSTGTSGSALIVDPNASTGLGTVVGVIGGYQDGGDTDSVSYAAEFSVTTKALYRQALLR